jgi:carbonic anhydrase/acetyltransferase-like protein (isoleucine patch superfamily)
MDSREYAFEGEEPEINGYAHVSNEATVVGDVTIEANASVWPGVVLRGDVAPVEIGRESAIGDNATLHASTVGENVMVGHGAVLNDATVEDGALVGFNSTVMRRRSAPAPSSRWGRSSRRATRSPRTRSFAGCPPP